MGRGSSKAGGTGGGIGGSGLMQTKDLDHSPTLQAALDKEEKRTRDLKREQMTVWDKDDQQVIHRQGGKGSVSYSTREAQEYFYGATMTHNHPHGDDRGGMSVTFSTADLEPFRFGLKEMRATGAEGTYVLRNKNWNNTKTDKGFEFWKAYEKFESEQSFISLENVKAAQAKAKKTSIGKQYDKAMKKAGDLWNSGKKDEAQKIFNDAMKNLEPKYKRETKRFLYENCNKVTSGWLKQNAPKYGFEYILTR